jgi:putative addiction module killer protein
MRPPTTGQPTEPPDLAAEYEALARANSRPQKRISLGNSGDSRSVGEGVSELRIHYGPGYRIYLKKQGDALVILLAGGEKSSHDQDIRLAKDLARNL